MTTTPLRAYHGDHALKAATMARVAEHRRLDQLVQGIGAQGKGADFRGCAVGCTLGTYDHWLYPERIGVPEELAHLEDAIFEGLAGDQAMAWPERFLGAIRPGADLSLVWSRFALWLLDAELGTYPSSAPVAALYRRRLAGDEPTATAWAAAKAAAKAAAWDRYATKLLALLEAA